MGESTKISRAEADRQLDEFDEWSRKVWNEAETVAKAIVEKQGLDASKIGFHGYSSESGYTVFVFEEFYRLDTDGQWQKVMWGQESTPEEDTLWYALEDALAEFGTDLPPGTEGRVEDPADLATSDLEMSLFADFDGDGNFQYDDKGIKSVVEDTRF